jgi:hypothetical protein
MPSRLSSPSRSLAPIVLSVRRGSALATISALLMLALFAFPQTGRAGESARSPAPPNTHIGDAVRVERQIAAADAPAWTIARPPASAPERKLLSRAVLAAALLVLNVLLLRRRRTIHNWDSC